MSLVHLHLILNHVPVIGTVFVLLVLGLALWRRSSELGKLALGSLIVIGIVSAAVYLTGEPSEEAVEHLAGVSDGVIHLHEDAAAIAMLVASLLGTLSLALLWWYHRRDVPRAVLGIALVGVLVLTGAMGWAANLGGRIRHTEIGNGTVVGTKADDH